MPGIVPITDFPILRERKLCPRDVRWTHQCGNGESIGVLVRYSTASLKLSVCLSVPLVAVTTTVEVPAAVGLEGGVEEVVPPPLPPPHPIAVIAKAQIVRASTVPTRRLPQPPNRKMPEIPTPMVAIHQRGCRMGGMSCAADPVVVTVRTVDPLPVTEAGLKVHFAPAGRPEQELELKLMVPL